MLIHQSIQWSPIMKPHRSFLALPDHAERRRRLLAETLQDLRLASQQDRPELIRAKVRHCRAVIAMYSESEAARLGYPALLAAILDEYGAQP